MGRSVSGPDYGIAENQSAQFADNADEVTIREYQPGDASAFRVLNEEWIMRYFALEAHDAYSLNDPQGAIIDRGGRIFMAVRGETAIGCCALTLISAGEFEVAKMSVTEAAQGGGIGRRLLEFVLNTARLSGARRLYLETNHTLQPAIRLYKAIGFQPVPPERIVQSPYARADVFMELFL